MMLTANACSRLVHGMRSSQRSPLAQLSAALLISSASITAISPACQAYTPYLPPINDRQFEQDAALLMEEARQLAQIPQQRDLAILRAKLATQLAPRDPDAWAILGGIYLLNNQAAAGIPSLEKAKTLAPKEPAIWFRLGNAYFQNKEYPKSIETLQTGLKLKPNTIGAMFDLGNAYFLNDNTDEAIKLYEAAFAQDKTFWFPLNNIGLIRYKQGNTEEAIKLWRTCIGIDAKEAEPKLALAAALYKQGNRFQGIRLASDAMKHDLRYSEAQFMRDNLWSEELITDAVKVLSHPIVQAAIVKAQNAAIEQTTRTP
jgi:tetratricopeptide (TPR) repeat protein